MKNKEQTIFVDELIENVRIDIQKNISKNWDKIENWDGHELRKYISDKFKESDLNLMSKSRKKAYRNTILIYNM